MREKNQQVGTGESAERRNRPLGLCEALAVAWLVMALATASLMAKPPAKPAGGPAKAAQERTAGEAGARTLRTRLGAIPPGGLLYITGASSDAPLSLGSSGQCLGSNGTALAWLGCAGGSGNLPASWSVATTNAVTGEPAASQDATTLALAPSLATGGTADIFDVCSVLPCSSGTKYFSVGFNGSIGMNVSNFTLSTTGAAPYFGLNASGGAPAQGYLKYITAALLTPTACAATTATTGGTWAAGTYWFECTYVNAAGETVNQAAFSVVTTGSTSTVTITAPGLSNNAFGYQVYCYSSTTGSTPCTSSASAPSQSGYGLVIPTSAQCTLSASTFHSNALCYPNANATWTAAPTPTTASAPASNTTGNLPSSIDALQNSAEGYGLCVAQGSSSSDCAAGEGMALPGGTGLSLNAGTTPTTSGAALLGNLACISGSLTAAECASNATNVVGVFQGGYQVATVQTTGIATVSLAASVTTNAGDFACTNGTAGTVVDSASACAAGRQVGYIAQTNGTAVSSVPVLLTVSGGNGGGGGSGSAVTLQTNGTNNGSQSTLNLAAGSNITLTNSGGTVTIAGAGGSSGTLYSWQPWLIQGSNAGGMVANKVYLEAVTSWPTASITLNEIDVDVNAADTTSADLYSVGIYGPCAPGAASCALAAGSSATAFSATGLTRLPVTSTTLSAPPSGEYYYIAWTGNAGTAQLLLSPGQIVTPVIHQPSTTASSGGNLPSSIAIPAASWGSDYGYAFALHN